MSMLVRFWLTGCHHSPHGSQPDRFQLRVWLAGVLLIVLGSCGDRDTLEKKVKTISTPYSDHAFVMAIADGDQALIDRFLTMEFNPDAKNRFGDSAVHWSVYRGDLALLDVLLNRGANPDPKGSYEMTPLMWACKRGFVAIAQTLVASGAAVDARDQWDNTPLHHATKSLNPEMVDFLLLRGADVNACNDENEPPIFEAVRQQEPDIVRRLIIRGADLKIISASGMDVLEVAVDNEMTAVFRESIVVNSRPWVSAELEQLTADVVENLQDKPQIDWNRLKLKIHDLMNEQRHEAGLPLLTHDDDLAAVATLHSEDMATRSFFEHNSPEGVTPTQRAEQQGYVTRKVLPDGSVQSGIAENIFQGRLYDGSAYHVEKGIKIITRHWLSEDDLAQKIVQGLMDSPGHRKNILGNTYTRQGLGFAVDDDDRVYFTQDLW